MKHLGDITKINGATVPAVDVICGGSPCQDLSVAGKRAGLAGARSGLFMDQIRIIKEMRDESIRKLSMHGANVDFRMVKPRFQVWENVLGALSSNGGEDFRAVLEETARIADKTAVIPRPSGGKWSHAGCIMGDGWSIAWRVHDAQFWGVPQRRRRIALVADFAGGAAPEILFERKGLSGNPTESEGTRQDSSADPIRSIDTAGDNVTAFGLCSNNSNSMKSSNPHSGVYEADTTRTLDLNGGNPNCNQGGDDCS
jgi:DNA (cytosine-5)-methyltransferase 1